MPASEQLAKSIDHDVYTIIVKNARHLDFGDITLIKQAPRFWQNLMVSDMIGGAFGVGTIDGFKVTEIVNAYLVNFFNKYLKGQPSELLDGDGKKYTEIETKI